MFKSYKPDKTIPSQLKSNTTTNTTIPDNFSVRTQWKGCAMSIKDQGDCGGCWAFAAVEMLEDRFCIKSEGKDNLTLSVQDLISCDGFDGGCTGGDLEKGVDYLARFGVVDETCMKWADAKGEKI
jgi:cathepsin B